MKKIVAFCSFFTLIISWSCQTDNMIEDTVIQNITISNITDSEATLKWNNDLDTTINNTYFEMWVNDLLTKKLSENSDTLTGLIHKTQYKVKVIAIEDGKTKYTIANTFTTKENFPPINFSISFDSLTSTGVTIFRTKAQDPEAKPITYKIYLNNRLLTEQFSEKRTRIEGLNPDSKNWIRVDAIDNQGNIISEKSSVITNATEGSLLHRYYLRVNSTSRECTLYFPPNYDVNGNYPLLLFFHGAGGYGWNDAQNAIFTDIADREGIILAFPQATVYDKPNTPSWCVDPGAAADALPYGNQLIDELLKKYPIDSKRVYATGMSSGGFMSFYLGQYIPEKIAAIAPAAATPTRFNFLNRKINQPLPLLVIFGTKDELIKGGDWQLSLDETIEFWTTNNHCSKTPIITELPNISSTSVTLFEYPDTTNSGNRILYYRMNGGGHWWPGANPVIADIIAEEVVWDFFKDIRKK